MSATAEDMAKQPQTTGSMIDALFTLREQYRALNAEAKAIKEQMDELEWQLMKNLDDQDVRMSRGGRASVTISEQEVPTIEDWDQVKQYAKDNDADFLFERRVAAGPWRELLEAGVVVPGTKPFLRRTLSLRKV